MFNKAIFKVTSYFLLFLLTASLVLVGGFGLSLNQAKADATTEPLLQQTDLTYLGGFRVPTTNGSGGNGFNYGGGQLAFNPAGNGGAGSLYIGGHILYKEIAEISIPALVNSSNPANMNTATLLQPLVDPTEGKLSSQISSVGGIDGALLGGLLVYGGQLVGTSYIYYDANRMQRLSHYMRPLNLSDTGNVGGFYDFGYTYKTGYVSGPMAMIPPEWQALLGGPVVTENFDLSIVSRTSYGPAAFVFDPANLGVVNPVPSTGLIYYPNNGDFNGRLYNATSNIWNISQHQGGVVFPVGSRSLLYFSVGSTGPYCYGLGGSATPPYADQSFGAGMDASTDATGTVVTVPGVTTSAIPNGAKIWLKNQVTPGSYTALGISVVTGFGNSGTASAYLTVNTPFPANLFAQPYTLGELNCLDPENPYKGAHGYPYVYQVLAFDANDLAAVKAGTRSPSSMEPYARWEFSLPTSAWRHTFYTGNIAYDPATQRIFIAQETVEGGGKPLIHVFQVNAGQSSNLPAASLSASPTTITSGASSTLTWSASNATSVSINQGIGTVASSGTRVVSPTTTTTYTLTATNALGSATSSTTVTVNAAPTPTLRGDLNHDGIVNSIDWSMMNSKWFTADATADLNHDGIVNSIDFSILNANWFRTN